MHPTVFAECFRVLESGAKVEVMKVEVSKY